MPANSLLHHPLLTWTADGAERRTHLPDLLAALLTRDVRAIRFPRVGVVQRSHWWRFLVRCATQALHDEDLSVETAAAIEEADLASKLLDALTARTDGEGAWLLHQQDPARPGFLQPPTPDGRPPEGKWKANSLSFLTTALGAKNFERKIDTQREMEPEQAVHALVEFQGGAIFGGRGNYGSQLMGSGSGKGSGTPFMAALLPGGDCATFRHDVGVFLGSWDRLASDIPLAGEVWALWTRPWDGTSPLPASELTPAFIPMARQIRLGPMNAEGRFDTVHFLPSKAYRVLDHTEGGRFGDPFTPLIEDRKSDGRFKVRGAVAIDPHRPAYDYREIASFFADTDRRLSPVVAALADPAMNAEDEVTLVLEAVAFDQGKTLGFHRRELPLPVLAVRLSLVDESPLRVAHEFMLARVGEAGKAVRAATRVLVHGDPKPRAGDDAIVMSASRIFDESVDQEYMSFLFGAAAAEATGDSDYQPRWARRLSDIAEKAFRIAGLRLPRPNGYEPVVRAEAHLRARLRTMRERAGAEDGGQMVPPTGDAVEAS